MYFLPARITPIYGKVLAATIFPASLVVMKLSSPSTHRWLDRLLSLAILLALCVFLADSAWRIWGPQQRFVPLPRENSPNVASQLISARHFFSEDIAAPPVAASQSRQKTASGVMNDRRIALHGVLKSSNRTQSIAIVSINNGKPKAAYEGEFIAPGLRVDQIMPTRVYIATEDATIEVDLPIK